VVDSYPSISVLFYLVWVIIGLVIDEYGPVFVYFGIIGQVGVSDLGVLNWCWIKTYGRGSRIIRHSIFSD
jgi:hypothetical protein